MASKIKTQDLLFEKKIIKNTGPTIKKAELNPDLPRRSSKLSKLLSPDEKLLFKNRNRLFKIFRC